MKTRFRAVAISILFKPAVLLALAAVVSRVAEISGLGTELIAPAAGSLSETTGLSYDCAISLITGLITFCVFQVLSAAWSAISNTQHSLSR
jgi:hypothetical protein